MIKILYIHHVGNFSGAARSLAYLINNLDTNKYDPTVLFLENGSAVDYFRDLNIKVVVDKHLYPFHGTTVSGMSFKRLITNGIGFFITLFRFPKVLKRTNPDIIHLNTSCLFTFAMVAKRMNKHIKVVSHIREPLLDSIYGKPLRYFNEKYVDHLIAISNYDASKFSFSDKIKVIYNFVDTNVYNVSQAKSTSFRTKYNISKESIVFLYLSRVSPTNGALEFVNIANEVSRSYSNFAFVVTGYNPNSKSEYNQNVKRIADSNPQIYLLNMITDVIDLIAESDVMVSPFTVPHFSRSVIEGAAMGKPAIISNVGSQNELVIDGQTGLIFEPGDSISFKNAIITLGSNKELREKMGLNARSLALEKFSMEKNVKETTAVYKSQI